MSFKFKSTMVTMSNYQEIFKECTPDILDEIRSAVLDDTPISKYIKGCGDDSYKLGQIRMALREMIPHEYLSTEMTGRTIYYIRQGFNKGIDMSPVLRYIKNSHITVEEDTLEQLTGCVCVGVSIEFVDFTVVPNNLVNTVCKGLKNGYPMWLLIEEGCTLSEETMRVLMRGMQLGIDVHPFLNGLWQSKELYLLFSYVKSVDINKLLGQITHKFDVERLKIILRLASRGIDYTPLCAKDTEGFPVYNQYQMYELASAIEDDCATEAMFNINLSDMDIFVMHEEELKRKNRVLNVSLNKAKKS